VNGAGKSSVAGATLRAGGGAYFNPDEYTRQLMQVNTGLTEEEANGIAWKIGYEGLLKSIETDTDYSFETTLGGNSVTAALRQAIAKGMTVNIWYVGLDSVERHIERVAARVDLGGHMIPEASIRKRYGSSRENLISLLPGITELQVYDNSSDAPPANGECPEPRLLLHLKDGKIVALADLAPTPEWAKPIIAAALKLKP
jgi:predicted ABC-type ATPase